MSKAAKQNYTAAISGRITDTQGNPISKAAVMFTGDSPAHTDIAALTDGQGRYHYTDLIPGTYTVLVNAESYPAQTQQVQAISGQVVQLDFRLSN